MLQDAERENTCSMRSPATYRVLKTFSLKHLVLICSGCTCPHNPCPDAKKTSASSPKRVSWLQVGLAAGPLPAKHPMWCGANEALGMNCWSCLLEELLKHAAESLTRSIRQRTCSRKPAAHDVVLGYTMALGIQFS